MPKSDVIHETGEFYGTMPSYDEAPDELPAGTSANINLPTLPIHKVRCAGPEHGYNFGYRNDKEGLWYAHNIDWRTVRKSAPSPLPEFRAKVGDWIESTMGGIRHVGKVTEFDGAMVRCSGLTLAEAWQNWDKDVRPWTPRVGDRVGFDDLRGTIAEPETDGLYVYVRWDDSPHRCTSEKASLLRPAQHPVESIPEVPSGGASGQSKAANSCIVCLAAIPSVASRCAYCAHDRAIHAGSMKVVMSERDAAYRSRVAAVLADIDRPLRIPKHHQHAPCVIGRTEKRVSWIDPRPAPWEGEDE